jgi:protein-disulfide isomerase
MIPEKREPVSRSPAGVTAPIARLSRSRPLNITRRTFTATLSLTAVAAALGLSPWQLVSEASAQTASEIAQAGELGDMALGSKDAPVTIIEYASMTCPHCAAFTKDVFPQIKTNYIDTGKVRFIFREFPLDQVGSPPPRWRAAWPRTTLRSISPSWTSCSSSRTISPRMRSAPSIASASRPVSASR